MKQWLLFAFAILHAAELHAAPFTDITTESNLTKILSHHYESFPKWWLSGLTFVDLDGDGSLDLHIASHSGPTMPALAALNDGRGHFTAIDPAISIARGPHKSADLPYPGGEIRLAYDLHEDGRLDLLCSWHDGGGALYLNQSKPGSTLFHPSDLLDPFSRATAIADINNDGRADYLADDRDKIRILLARAGAPGQFDPKPAAVPALKESCAIPIDLDGDGNLDLLVTQRGYNPTRRLILHNDGQMHFIDITKSAGLDPEAGSIHGGGDVNHDGHVDLICIEGDRVEIYLNDTRGHFTKLQSAVRSLDKVKNKPHSTNWGGAIVTDVDNDGRADVLINGRYFLYILKGSGDGTFDVANQDWGITTNAFSAVDEGLCFGDTNNDGALDLLTCAPGPNGKEKGLTLLRNDLPKHHWLRVRPLGAPGNRAAANAKIRITDPATHKLLWYEQITLFGRQSFHSYYATTPTERHFGLGDRETVDVSVEFHPSRKLVEQRAVKADTAIEINEN
ncbi:MAG TPA: VCBS repeat-containing protein [Tepidisphaeraceae bacterium]|nr:VCBS repeat-containing protein [Tepidisphaeraceae bacterium]